MNDYDFNKEVPRLGTACVKWNDPDPEVIPLWVADMDFPAAPCIVEALRKRLEHGIFGYVDVPLRFYDAVTAWMSRRHGWTFPKEWLLYTTGVVPAISAVVKALAQPGEEVIVLTPVYNCFFSSIRNNGCTPVEVPLLYNAETGRYTIDYEAFERAAARPQATMIIFCNPHNPAGRAWTASEMERVWQIAKKHGVAVVSDEIHCEIVMPGCRYTPMASINEEMKSGIVTCFSSSKSFNTAGLQTACITCAEPQKRQAIDRAININEVCDINPFGMEALIAAYSPQGEKWLEGLNDYISGNFETLRNFISTHLPQLTLTPNEATYLAWLNVEPLGMTGDQVTQLLYDKAKVRLNSGSMYGDAGKGFVRINLATQRSLLQKALKRVEALI